jgi:Domain of unknown function (DUF4157)
MHARVELASNDRSRGLGERTLTAGVTEAVPVGAVLDGVRRDGGSRDSDARAAMAQRFDRDFTRAPVRGDSLVADLAHDILRFPMGTRGRPALAFGMPQCKLTFASANDPLERAAEDVAESVVGGNRVAPGARCRCGGTAGPTGECAGCRARREAAMSANRVARRPTGRAPVMVPGAVSDVVATPGRPLEPAARTFMEPRFGRSFGDVRIHDDRRAADSAAQIHAEAYTLGRHVVFGAGRYAPSTESGRRLLAHELAHVVQQDGARPALMRRALPFEGPFRLRQRYHEGDTKFEVKTGAIAVTGDARWHIFGDQAAPGRQSQSSKRSCGTPDYKISVTQERTLRDQDYGACSFSATGPTRRVWNALPSDTYYLTFFLPASNNQYCSLEGSVTVEELTDFTGNTCTEQPATLVEMLHDGLAAAGLLPVLGAVPDVLNAGVYLIQGDWKEAGFSVAMALPFLGEGFKVARVEGKIVIRAEEGALKRVGRDGLANALKDAKAEAKVAEKTELKAEAKAAEKTEAKGARKAEGKAAEKEGAKASEHGGKLAKGAKIPGLEGCVKGSIHCPVDYLAHEFKDLFKGREKADFAKYLRHDIPDELEMGRSLRKEQKILTGEPMYRQFMREVPESSWSEPFRHEIEHGRTRPLRVGKKNLRWPIDDIGDPWVVHHDPPLGWVTAESSELWHPMPYRMHDDAHRWWNQLARAIRGDIPKKRLDELIKEGVSVLDII